MRKLLNRRNGALFHQIRREVMKKAENSDEVGFEDGRKIVAGILS